MKEIQLTQGKVALVDDEDFDELNHWKWYFHIRYAQRKDIDGKKIIHMHREIIKPPFDMFVDHINGDGLLNIKNNLRICTKSQNGANKDFHINNTSGYKGVVWNKANKNWRVRIGFNGKKIEVGSYLSLEEAAKEYNKAAVEYFGNFARLNEL